MRIERRSILIDEPSREDQFNGKGHERTAIALSKAIATFYGNDRAIGLDGPWGSGKSTVVEIARRILDERKTKENRAYHFFTFDIWQSQGSSFRRSLLEHFLEWTISTFPAHRSRLLDVEKKVKGKVREVASTNQSILDWWGVLVIAALPFLPLYYLWAKKQLDAATKDAPFYMSYSFSLLVLFLLGTLVWAFGKMILGRGKRGVGSWRSIPGRYRIALSQTLLIGSKQFEDQKVTQYIRETDPNDFEFQTTLREILSIVQSNRDRVVIVLDNIDRLPKKELDDYWAQVRAVFSGNPAVRKTEASECVTVIVPYHRHLVEEHNSGEAGTRQAGGEQAADSRPREPMPLSPLGAREIFTKTFDEILQVSPPVMSNSREFFIAKMRRALPDVSDRDELFRVYLIFDRIIRNQGGSATPRQIIGFINELAGMYVLHDGRFKLPTVAVYIAYQDALEASPALLNDRHSLDSRVRQIADDADLERNLAAMIFNVEPDLALQLMLDQRIKDAAVRGPERLIEISKAAGFDVRVDQVVQENADEWNESGELPGVLSNFAALSEVYEGDAKVHFRRSLVVSAKRLHRNSFSPNKDAELLKVIELVEPDGLTSLVRSLATASHDLLIQGTPLSAEDGMRWVSFLGSLRTTLLATGSGDILSKELGSIKITSDPRFMFGMASRASQNGISLYGMKQVRVELDREETLYPSYALDRPEDMRAALGVMDDAGLIENSQKQAIFHFLEQQLQTEEVGDLPRFRQHVELAAELYARSSSSLRPTFEAGRIFHGAPFFDHLTKAMETPDDPVLGSALFLAMQTAGQSPLPPPTKLARNGVSIPDETDSFILFKNTLEKGEGVSPEQIERLAELHKMAAVFTPLVSAAANQTDNGFRGEVVRRGLLTEPLPRISLSTLNLNYDFLRPLLGDGRNEFSARFDGRIDDAGLAEIGLSDWSATLIGDTQSIKSEGWTKVREQVAQQLRAVPMTDWPVHVADDDEIFEMLLQMIEGSDFVMSDPGFRDVVIQLMLDVLSGELTLAGEPRLDLLMRSVDSSFHADMYRQMREGVRDVNATTLDAAVRTLPSTVGHIITARDQLRKEEKDSLVRFFLCPALEGSIEDVLKSFESLGHSKVKDMVSSSQESTREKLQGAVTVFSAPLSQRSRARTLGELLYGKRKAKSFLDIWFGSSGE
ncbi:P-loop NTPase fold protein [Rhizobium sp. Leaf383]|uniref:P-loop NTPase fold protein n=1 Tax=Rhizobium sp. Leaf383 TaxID=1736357 RepID=UPI000713E1B0|nr:P-loop NTPase fold protein [Rhizobium sp. Leaf383]KQS76406.1 hypothetical protein ASG58_11315 [Rhizobium sp. Leaf383]